VAANVYTRGRKLAEPCSLGMHGLGGEEGGNRQARIFEVSEDCGASEPSIVDGDEEHRLIGGDARKYTRDASLLCHRGFARAR
jgi:hypothetical protein